MQNNEINALKKVIFKEILKYNELGPLPHMIT